MRNYAQLDYRLSLERGLQATHAPHSFTTGRAGCTLTASRAGLGWQTKVARIRAFGRLTWMIAFGTERPYPKRGLVADASMSRS